MADSIKTPEDLLAVMPSAEQRAMGYGPGVADEVANVYTQEIRDAVQLAVAETRGKLGSKVFDHGGTELVSSDGTSGSTIAIYRLDLSAGDLLANSIYARFAAQADIVLIGAGEWGKSLDADGNAAVVLSADGKTYAVALVCVDVNGTPTLYAIFGAEADDASEVEPNAAYIRTSLAGASIANLRDYAGVVVARFKIRRVATDTIAMVHTDPASDDALAAERAVGTLGGVVTESSS